MAALTRIQNFLKLEASGGIILFLAAFAAFLISNSPLANDYQAFFQIPIAIDFGTFSLHEPLFFWINEGLMSIFFLLIGLELKREFVAGELSDVRKIALPGVAALGGMIVPACAYLLFNYDHPLTVKGWAIPVATDIAFALGVLSLAGKKIPYSLKLFLMTLAIFDDLGAILIIAMLHSKALSWVSICVAVFLIFLLFCLNRFGVRKLFPYLILGICLWFSVLQSGVHATVSGVILALMIPAHKHKKGKSTPLQSLERRLHPFVAYFILPLFAFANAGVSLQGLSWSVFLDPVVIGIVSGLFLGKQFGVFAAAWALIRLKMAELPQGSTWLQVYGVALLCGIGFTMSLFLGTLAFEDSSQSLFLIEVRIGVLSGSILSGILGMIILQLASSTKRERRFSG